VVLTRATRHNVPEDDILDICVVSKTTAILYIVIVAASRVITAGNSHFNGGDVLWENLFVDWSVILAKATYVRPYVKIMTAPRAQRLTLQFLFTRLFHHV
jgi:hypothetical protein